MKNNKHQNTKLFVKIPNEIMTPLCDCAEKENKSVDELIKEFLVAGLSHEYDCRIAKLRLMCVVR